MQAGKLRERVTVQAASSTTNDYGEVVTTWSNGATVWGELRPLLAGTREAFAQRTGQEVAEASWQVRMRHRALSPAANRLVIDGRVFDVEVVMDPDGRRREVVALCREVQS